MHRKMLGQRPAATLGRILGSSAAQFSSPLARWNWSSPSNLRGQRGENRAGDSASNLATARDSRMARLEAVLVLAREPFSTRKLAQMAGLADGTEARTLIRRLNKQYDESGTAFRAEEVAGGWQLLTRERFGVWLARLFRSAISTRLSAPAMETLVVVAYQQPVLRAQIEAVRGVDCGEILRQLMERGLVRIVGRSEDLGRPYLYGTTKRFQQVFGLRDLDDLPRAEFLRAKHRRTALPADSMTSGIAAEPEQKQNTIS